MSSRDRSWQHERYERNIRQERGKHCMEYVRKSTSARRLLDPKRQVYDLVLLNDGTSHRAICDILIQQYKLAKDFGDLRWIDTVRKECTTSLCTKRWVDEHLSTCVHHLPFLLQHHLKCVEIFVYNRILICLLYRRMLLLLVNVNHPAYAKRRILPT